MSRRLTTLSSLLALALVVGCFYDWSEGGRGGSGGSGGGTTGSGASGGSSASSSSSGHGGGTGGSGGTAVCAQGDFECDDARCCLETEVCLLTYENDVLTEAKCQPLDGPCECNCPNDGACVCLSVAILDECSPCCGMPDTGLTFHCGLQADTPCP
jgi:hypothetical protein